MGLPGIAGRDGISNIDDPPSIATELSEDLSYSPLWNPDLAPTPLARRTWSTYHIAALWIGMSVVITTYTLASGLMQEGMTWWQALLTILLGNVVVLMPMILNAHAGTKYGVSFPVLCRASFGVRGANVPATLRALVACGWFGIQTWIGGLALNALLAAALPFWANLPANIWIAFAIFWLVQAAIILRGLEGIKILESWSAPLLLGGGALLLWWAIRNGGGLAHILTESARLQTSHAPFWQLFPAALTANVGYWATLSLNIPDFTRYARSQRSQALGQALGLPATMTAFAFIGVAVTSATIVMFGEAIWDPVVLIARIGSPLVIMFGALIVLIAQLTTNMAANVVSPANDFSSLAPRRISYVAGGLITAVVGILMMPWKLYADAGAYIFTWLTVEALRGRGRVHLYLADRVLQPYGRHWRHSDRRLLGASPAPTVAHGSVQTRWTLPVCQRGELSRHGRSGTGNPAGHPRIRARRSNTRRARGQPDVSGRTLYVRLVRHVWPEFRFVPRPESTSVRLKPG
jgi:nucleobase:cation symporter-1, NCS1 family